MILAAIITTIKGTEATARAFTSPDFWIVYGLMAINFIVCGVDHLRSRRRSLAFILIHLGTLVIIGGASYGHFTQVKGFMTLYQQKSDNRVVGRDEKGEMAVIQELPFTLHLDRFWLQYYERDEATPLYLVAFSDSAEDPNRAHLQMRIDPDGEMRQVVNGAVYEIEAFYRDAKVTEEVTGSAALIVENREDGSRKTYPIKAGQTVTLDGFDAAITPMKIYRNARVSMSGGGLTESREPPLNPAILVAVSDPADAEPVLSPLFANMPDFHGDALKDKPYRILYRASQSTFSVTPGGGDACAARVKVTKGDRSDISWYVLDRPGIPASRRLFEDLLVGLRAPAPRVKDFKSRLSVFEGNELVASKVIEVNHPLSYGGFLFYQNSYDQQGHAYTVLEVVRDPGFWWVAVGFLLLTLGVIQKFYLDPLFSKRMARTSLPGARVPGESTAS